MDVSCAIKLEQGRILRLGPGRAACAEGVVWLSWKGGDDAVLEAGESADVPAAALAEAILGPAALAWTSTAPEPAARKAAAGGRRRADGEEAFRARRVPLL